LLEVARENPQAPAHPAPVVFFSAFGESSLDFELGIWSEEMSDVHIRTGRRRTLDATKICGRRRRPACRDE